MRVFHAHDHERSALCAEMGFESDEEQFIFESCMRFECERKEGDAILEVGDIIERRQRLFDVPDHEVEYAVFAEQRVCD